MFIPTAHAVQGSEIRVPQDVATPREAIVAAHPGDTIVLAAGVYPGGYVVPRAKHDLTIVGTDRNAVVLAGDDRRRDGIVTNATGVLIRDSVFDRNGAGIVPNSYSNEALAPEARTRIVSNTIIDSGRARVPIATTLASFIGIGVAIAGGNDNVVSGNRILRSERYGVAVFSTARFVSFTPGAPEPGPRWVPRGNRVSRNTVTGSGVADLALAQGSGRNNCFERNTAARTRPLDLQSRRCTAAGDRRVAAELTRRVQDMVREMHRRRHPPPYRTMPAPPPQPNMRR